MAHFLKQVNRLTGKFPVSSLWSLSICRLGTVTTGSDGIVYGKLSGRGLLQIQGKDASSFLQGLITNDMRHFDEHETDHKHESSFDEAQAVGHPVPPLKSVSGLKKSMYSMLLNVRGQILYDLILYNLKSPADPPPSANFLVECDAAGLADLMKHLKRYQLRKELEISDVTDQFTIWVICKFLPKDATPEETKNLVVPEVKVVDPSKIACITKDPRTQALGYRMILPTNISPKMVLAESLEEPTDLMPAYVNLRHKLGVWEGVDDIPPAECYPLECNADYMHGVSFHKGCYVGQELTARSHHTGVIRKRVMPIMFDFEDSSPIAKWTTIENELGRSVGRFISKLGRFGLAQIRMHEALTSSQIRVKGHNGKLVTFKPSWWPIEQPKSLE